MALYSTLRCKRKYELAPARILAEAQTVNFAGTTNFHKEFEGYGLFVPGSDEPERLDELWLQMREPKLQRGHEAYTKPVDDANQRVAIWSVVGLVVGGTGIGTAAAVQERSQTAANVAGLLGLGVLLVGAVAAIESQPSGESQVEAEARRRLFLRGEDDPRLILRGVNGLNTRQRVACER